MKKATLLLLLVLAILLPMSACDRPAAEVGPTEPDPPHYESVKPPQLNGVYQIAAPEHLLYMAQHPDSEYVLCDDIDMGGYIWDPIDNFSGTLSGMISSEFNYIISNLRIEAQEDDENVGFFRKVTGSVERIDFDNIRVNVAGAFSGNVGVLAGTCNKSLSYVRITNSTVTAAMKDGYVGLLVGRTSSVIRDCYIAGELKLDLAGGRIYASGGVGYAGAKVKNLESRTDILINGQETSGAAGGIVGYAAGAVENVNYGGRMSVNTDAKYAAGALVGYLRSDLSFGYNNARSAVIVGAVSADAYCGVKTAGVTVSDCCVRDTANLDENLPEAEYALRRKAVDYMYEMCTIRWSPSEELEYQCKFHNWDNYHYQRYIPGKWYFGMPYNHGCASLERMQAYMNADGTISTDVDEKRFFCYFGTDCTDTVMWSWQQVSGSISATYTEESVCMNGVVAVGEYTVGKLQTTAQICGANGAKKMYQAYAQVKMGDGLLWAPGHFRMAAEAAYVYYKADGSIDPDKSYILCHEQGTAITSLEQTHSTCQTNVKYSFSQLFKTDYIPVTIEAFANGKADDPNISVSGADLTRDGIAQGVIISNYRLKWVRLTITDENGNRILDAVDTILGIENAPEHRWYTEFSMSGSSVLQEAVSALRLDADKKYTCQVRVGYSDEEYVVQEYVC